MFTSCVCVFACGHSLARAPAAFSWLLLLLHSHPGAQFINIYWTVMMEIIESPAHTRHIREPVEPVASDKTTKQTVR